MVFFTVGDEVETRPFSHGEVERFEELAEFRSVLNLLFARGGTVFPVDALRTVEQF